MENKSRGKLAVTSCKSGIPFGNKVFEELCKIAKAQGTSVFPVNLNEVHFANTEIKSVFEDSIRGSDLYIIQDIENSVEPSSVNDNFMALKTAIDAAYRSDAHYVTAVIPTFPYARQDRRTGKESITAALIAREIEDCEAERVITLDIHNPAIAGYFRRTKFENLHASKSLIDYIKSNKDMSNFCVLSPDAGGTERANYFAKQLGRELGIVHKQRDYSRANTVEKTTLLGDVKGKDVLIIDDMLDTGGTLNKVVRMLKEKEGCNKIYFACSLPLLNGKAIDIIDALHNEGLLEQIITTDAVYHGGAEFAKKHTWFTEVSVAKYFAKVIYNINNHESISALLK